MTQISREVEGQVPIPFKTSRIVPDNDAKQVIAEQETQNGKEVEDNIKVIQKKGNNIDVIA